MLSNWFDETKKELRNGDQMQKSYLVELNGHEGYLVLTDERVIFIKTDGFLKIENDKKILYLFYHEIEEIVLQSTYSFCIILDNGKKFSFITLNIPANFIIKSILKHQNQINLMDQLVDSVMASQIGFGT
jgi:hypothetical protein